VTHTGRLLWLAQTGLLSGGDSAQDCPDQYHNPDNVAAYRPLATELVAQLGRIDVLVAAVGTGGHSAGTTSVLCESLPDLALIGVDAVGLALYRVLGAETVLIVPMRVRRQVLGAITFVRHTPSIPFDEQEQEQALAADLGHRAGLALDNARLYALQQQTAEQLQLPLLPDLTGLEHLELAARYVAARERAEVDGDWYDAFPLPDGSAILAIGDVVGHDLAAASAWGSCATCCARWPTTAVTTRRV
jgi:hypothetical protein